MAKYRKISPRFWNDAKVRTLSDNARYVMLFTLTHPTMTRFGAIRANFSGLGCELGWSGRKFKKAIMEIVDAGMARIDEQAGIIWFPNFMKYNMPESPNVIKSWAGAYEDLPECDLREAMLEALQTLAQRLGKAFSEAFEEAFAEYMDNDFVEAYAQGSPEALPKPCDNPCEKPCGKGMPNQEQEQEQDLKAVNPCAETSSTQELLTPEVTAAPDPVFISLPCIGHPKIREVEIRESQVAYYQELYPAVDVRQQLRNIKGWMDANPKKRKTPDGVPKCIANWLADKQNKGGNSQAQQPRQTQGAQQTPAARSWENYQRLKARQQESI